jgi:hypothetical protein
MEVNGLYARINTPPALVGEGLNALPPHCLRPVYAVDEYPACPENWMHGSAKASSYFVPVTVNRGMWFDFTMNAGHRHDIAIVVSVQGVNPVTGKKVTELNLEQYREKCPVHNIQFQQDRFCVECGHKWPGQNYIATTTGQTLWIDGFRNEKGEVRQYIVTEEVARGIAAQVVGNDRVWAIGFAFYLSKEPRHQEQKIRTCGFALDPHYTEPGMDFDADMKLLSDDGAFGLSGSAGPTGSAGSQGQTGAVSYNMANVQHVKSCSLSKGGVVHDSSLYKGSVTCSSLPSASRSVMRSTRGGSSVQPIVQKKTLEIGAGARINQEIGVDANPIDYWQAEPIGLIYANYVNEETAHRIIMAGKRQDKKDGALHTLKVGN